ncbi:hypothetical protein AB0J35_29805 [Nonomuraea angiospora]|uniref:hypothetical protein n=1 Tax=Nonomuraea angiospora TaxID=46172 RepID=UPI00342CD7FD
MPMIKLTAPSGVLADGTWGTGGSVIRYADPKVWPRTPPVREAAAPPGAVLEALAEEPPVRGAAVPAGAMTCTVAGPRAPR